MLICKSRYLAFALGAVLVSLAALIAWFSSQVHSGPPPGAGNGYQAFVSCIETSAPEVLSAETPAAETSRSTISVERFRDADLAAIIEIRKTGAALFQKPKIMSGGGTQGWRVARIRVLQGLKGCKPGAELWVSDLYDGLSPGMMQPGDLREGEVGIVMLAFDAKLSQWTGFEVYSMIWGWPIDEY